MSTAPNRAVSQLTSAPIDRRERRRVAMHGFVVRSDGSSVEILVLDLSYEGCGIETPVALEAGEALKLSVLRRGAIDTHVRWYVNGRAGLVFDPEPEAPKGQVPRKWQRTRLTAQCGMRRLGKMGFKVQLFDLSTHGCKIDLVERPSIGEHVTIKFDGLELLEAEVCWVEGGTAGLRFEKPIHSAVFDLLLERLR